jgi:hypothetical protein
LEDAYSTAARPADSLEQIESLTAALFALLRRSVAPGSDLQMDKAGRTQNFYEDVFVTAADSATFRYGEIAQIDRATAEELLAAGGLAWSLKNLHERRHEILYTFWKFAVERWPGQDKIAVLEFFHEAQPIWHSYISHLAAERDDAFNPYQLPEIDELYRLRREIQGELSKMMKTRDDGMHLPIEPLQRLTSRIPVRFQSPIGPCLLVQPTDRRGNLWVANHLFEGNGRLSSRFTPLMDEVMRAYYIDHFTERSMLSVEGEPAELVDILFTHGSTVNLHWPQTRKIIEIPGELSDLPPERRIRLSQLVVHVDQQRKSVSLHDATGQRYIPSYLSALHDPFLPTLLKFLTTFGISSRGNFDFEVPTKETESAIESSRITVGNLVIQRKRWFIRSESIPSLGPSDEESYLQINLWRRRIGLPNSIYLIERVNNKESALAIFKPQYIDFGSPTFMDLFKAAIGDLGEKKFLIVEEALPLPSDFPTSSLGERWAVELMLESLSFAVSSSTPSGIGASGQEGHQAKALTVR